MGLLLLQNIIEENLTISVAILLLFSVAILSSVIWKSQQQRVENRQTRNRLEQQNLVLLALAKSKILAQANLNASLDQITEAAANTLGAERVSIWLYNSDRSKIECLNLYQQTLNSHTSGIELAAVDYPIYFQALETERTIAADDAYKDPRTCEFGAEYLPAVGVTSMLDAPIWLKGEMIGVVCHEYTGGVRHWTLEEQNFAGCIADLVTLAMEANQRAYAQEALKQSENRFRRLSEATFEGIIVIHNGVIVDVNQAAANMTNCNVAEMIGMNPLDFIAPEDRNLALHNLVSGYEQPYEIRYLRKDGSIQIGEVQGKTIASEGEILRVTAIRDITERKQTEAALAKRERYLATLVEVQRRLLADDSDGYCYTQILEPLEQASGASRVYLFENHRDDTGRLLTSQRAEWWNQHIKSQINHQELQNLSLSEVLPRWVEVLGRGEIIAGIVAEFPETEQAILVPQEILSILVLPLIVNNNFWGFIGFDNCSEARPWDSLEVDLLAAAAAAIALHQERALAEKALSQAKAELEMEVDNRTKALKDTNEQLLVEVAERSSAQRALQEVAQMEQSRSQELQQALENLKQAQAQLVQSEKMSSLGQMVAGIAHEINNPINFIAGNLIHTEQYISDLVEILHLYQEFSPEPPSAITERSQAIDLDFVITDLPNILQSMQTGAKRISDIVLSLRNFSRLDEAEIKQVNLHEGIDNTLLILQHRLDNKNNHTSIKIIKNYGKLPLVECYPSKLNQALLYIFNNAIDAIEESRIKYQESKEKYFDFLTDFQINIHTELSPNNKVRILIADNGAGMTEDIKARIFDPFFTTKPIGSGTGLGLTITYQIIVENHKGDLSCRTVLGKGTEFLIEIPIRQTSI